MLLLTPIYVSKKNFSNAKTYSRKLGHCPVLLLTRKLCCFTTVATKLKTPLSPNSSLYKQFQV